MNNNNNGMTAFAALGASKEMRKEAGFGNWLGENVFSWKGVNDIADFIPVVSTLKNGAQSAYYGATGQWGQAAKHGVMAGAGLLLPGGATAAKVGLRAASKLGGVAAKFGGAATNLAAKGGMAANVGSKALNAGSKVMTGVQKSIGGVAKAQQGVANSGNRVVNYINKPVTTKPGFRAGALNMGKSEGLRVGIMGVPELAADAALGTGPKPPAPGQPGYTPPAYTPRESMGVGGDGRYSTQGFANDIQNRLQRYK